MLTMNEAVKIGVNACIDKLGREFVQLHRDNGTSSYGLNENEDGVLCYVGVDDQPFVMPVFTGTITLDNTTHFPYFANCNVALTDGAVTFLECCLPH